MSSSFNITHFLIITQLRPQDTAIWTGKWRAQHLLPAIERHFIAQVQSGSSFNDVVWSESGSKNILLVSCYSVKMSSLLKVHSLILSCSGSDTKFGCFHRLRFSFDLKEMVKMHQIKLNSWICGASYLRKCAFNPSHNWDEQSQFKYNSYIDRG